MRAERFGSYSIAATVAGTPSLWRRKSMTRYLRLCPPPRCRLVIRPWTLRPAFLGRGASSDFSGDDRVMVAKSLTDPPRRAGEVGLNLRMAMGLPSGGPG